MFPQSVRIDEQTYRNYPLAVLLAKINKKQGVLFKRGE